MRSPVLHPVVLVLVVALGACGSEGERHVYKVSIEGQSPPAPIEAARAPGVPLEPPAPNTAGASSPAWLRANAPVEWTVPPGWEAEMSTKPQRIVEFTLEKNGPGGAPIQFLILNGADDSPNPSKTKIANLERWQQFYHEDRAQQMTPSEHDGLRVTKYKIHGTYEGYPVIGSSEPINEPNWTMIAGWVEGPNGSIMFKCQGPDAIMGPNEAKIDMLLNSMKPREQRQ